MQYVDKKSRDIDVVTSLEQKHHILSKYLLEKELSLRMDPFDQKVILKKILDGGNKILVYLPPESDFFFPMNVQLFKMLANYIHIDCDYVDRMEQGLVLLQVNKLEIARKNRENDRIVLPAGAAFATNIICNKTLIQSDMFNVPNLVKVHFDDFESRLSQKLESKVSIHVFRSDLSNEYDVVKKTKKFLWIPDTYNARSYVSYFPDQINYREEIDDDITNVIQKYKDQKICSELILPILYTNHLEEEISIGYISIQSKEKKISQQMLDDLKKIRTEIANRIKESNTVKVQEKFPILEVSRHGLRMSVTNPFLIESLQKHDRFVFDIYFKMQAPFTVSGIIRWTSKSEEGNRLDLGIEIVAKSSMPGERERYYKNIELAKQGKLQTANFVKV